MRKIETPLGPQTFTDGLAVFYRVKNEAGKGDRPKYTMEEFLRVPFTEKKVGDVRYYAAMQADSRISKVVRIPRVSGIQPSGDIVTLSGDDRQYKVQKVARNTMTTPESLDVTLEISKTQYKTEVAEGDSTGA
jgi:hypothetical protein